MWIQFLIYNDETTLRILWKGERLLWRWAEILFTCLQKCSKCFASKLILRRHQECVHQGIKYICIECNKSFSTLASMTRHTKKHSRSKHFTCKYCKKTLSRKEHLKRHEVSCYLKTYTTNVNKTNINQTPSAKNEMLFKCRHCLGQFGTKFALKRHIRTHLKPSTLAFQCVQCEKRFFREDNFKQHLEQHNQNKLFCSYCNKPFLNKIKLN